MNIRRLRALSLVCVICLACGALPPAVLAQEGTQHYENAALGITFDLPAGWAVAAEDSELIAADPADLAAAQKGDVPQGLLLRVTIGSFNELGITDALQLPDLLGRLVSSEVAAPPAPQSVQWGNSSGYQIEVALENEGLTTRLALLAIAGGRVAVVRGLARTSVWDGGAGVLFDSVAQSIQFSLPEREEDYLATVTSNDGGVLWHLQETPPESGRVVQAGGITYDMFEVMYMAVGPGGVMAINIVTGEYISYMGPWYDGNFVDIAIGPDTKLYMANIAENTINAVMVVDRAGNYTRGWGVRGNGDGEFAPGMPITIAVTKGGDVWTVSEGHSEGIRNRLYKFDSFGNLLLTVDLDAVNPALSGIHIDNNIGTGALYVVGATGNLNVIDTNGKALVVNLAQEILAGVTPLDIAIAPDDNIVLALPAPGLDGFGLLELSVAGRLIDVFGIPYGTITAPGGPFLPGEYQRPAGLVVGPDGTYYWTETNPNTGFTQVQAFLFRGDGRLPLGIESASSDAAPVEVLALDPSKGGGTLTYGETVHGSLNNRYPEHNWTFDGRAGEHIIITMVDASGAGLIDPKIDLKVADGRVIASNDDVGSVRPDGMAERDARLEFDLPQDGVYTITAGRFGGRGEYILTLDKTDAAD